MPRPAEWGSHEAVLPDIGPLVVMIAAQARVQVEQELVAKRLSCRGIDLI
jgi:hypothetical protein